MAHELSQTSADDRDVAVVLGGTSAHGILIDKLKSRGFRTVLVDYLDNPPAARKADIHIKQSALDIAVVTEIARDMQAAIVISTCVDQANIVACRVAEKLDLPRPYSAETAEIIGNKLSVKARLADLGIPTPRFVVAPERALSLTSIEIPFPMIVKPADSNGSKGVVRCDDERALHDAIKRAHTISRSRQALIEEFVDGIEYNIYSAVEKGKGRVVAYCRKYNHDSEGGTAITSFATWYTNSISPNADQKCRQITEAIAKGFGLENTVLLTQVLVRGDDVFVVEFAPRVGGGLSYWAVKAHTGIDLIEIMLQSYLGEPFSAPETAQSTHIVTVHLFAKPGIFGRIEGVDILLEDGTVMDYVPNKMPGMSITSEMASRDRVGSFVISANSKEDVFQRIPKIIEIVNVFDESGANITDKSTFLKKGMR